MSKIIVKIEVDKNFFNSIKERYEYSDEELMQKISDFFKTQTEYLPGLGSQFEMWLDEEEISEAEQSNE